MPVFRVVTDAFGNITEFVQEPTGCMATLGVLGFGGLCCAGSACFGVDYMSRSSKELPPYEPPGQPKVSSTKPAPPAPVAAGELNEAQLMVVVTVGAILLGLLIAGVVVLAVGSGKRRR